MVNVFLFFALFRLPMSVLPAADCVPVGSLETYPGSIEMPHRDAAFDEMDEALNLRIEQDIAAEQLADQADECKMPTPRNAVVVEDETTIIDDAMLGDVDDMKTRIKITPDDVAGIESFFHLMAENCLDKVPNLPVFYLCDTIATFFGMEAPMCYYYNTSVYKGGVPRANDMVTQVISNTRDGVKRDALLERRESCKIPSNWEELTAESRVGWFQATLQGNKLLWFMMAVEKLG